LPVNYTPADAAYTVHARHGLVLAPEEETAEAYLRASEQS